jgi:hypothetical protein
MNTIKEKHEFINDRSTECDFKHLPLNGDPAEDAREGDFINAIPLGTATNLP